MDDDFGGGYSQGGGLSQFGGATQCYEEDQASTQDLEEEASQEPETLWGQLVPLLPNLAPVRYPIVFHVAVSGSGWLPSLLESCTALLSRRCLHGPAVARTRGIVSEAGV